MPVSDVWRKAESSLVQAFVERGDLTGAQHARDFVLQMSHVGSNQYLMAADQALQNGDGVGAAQALAKAHAFFPDGTIGRFRTDGTNVYADRLDENDPTQRIGPPIQVTPQGVAGLLNQTTDPQKFLQTLTQQQTAASEARLRDQHGDYYAGLNPSREAIAADKSATQLQATGIRAGAEEQAATTRAQALTDAAGIRAQASGQAGGKGNAQEAALGRQADKETSDLYSSLAMPDATPEQRGELAEIHKDARMMGATPPQAERIANGLSDNTLQLLRLQDGNYGVISNGDKQRRPIAYLSKGLGDRLAGAPQQGPTPGAMQQPSPGTPIGAGAGSPFARGMGVSSNLAGTQMPQQPSSQQPPQQPTQQTPPVDNSTGAPGAP
jgi:hypothetical protein